MDRMMRCARDPRAAATLLWRLIDEERWRLWSHKLTPRQRAAASFLRTTGRQRPTMAELVALWNRRHPKPEDQIPNVEALKHAVRRFDSRNTRRRLKWEREIYGYF